MAVHLVPPPPRCDRYGRPWYDFEPGRTETDRLILDAIQDGYTRAVGLKIYHRVLAELLRARGTRLGRLMEIGGGDGWFFDLAAPHVDGFINVEPADLDLSGQARARLDDPRYTVVRCSAEGIPLPSSSIDCIASVASLDHVPHVRLAVDEIVRCLVPGGVFVGHLNNRASWWKRLLADTSVMRARQQAIADEHYVQWSVHEFAHEIGRVLTVQRAYTITYLPYIRHVSRPLLPLVDAIGERVAPSAGSNSVVVAVKL